MKKRLLYSFLIVILLGVSFVGTASAHHYLYWAEDPNSQDPNAPLKRNFVLVWWWWNSNARYWIDPVAGPEYASDVRTAINTKWEP